ncbi:MAG: hypothetical protein ACJAVK_003508 [Akkermansiaceae bacterium]|jgi:hypothetical protein
MPYFLHLSLFASLGFVSCQKGAEVIQVDDQKERALEMVALRSELARLEIQLVSAQNDRFRKDAEQAEVLSELAAEMKDLKDAAKPQVVAIPIEKVGVPAVSEEEDHGEERRLSRLKAEGDELAHLKTISGDEYHELVISRVTDIGVVFRHRGGIARIPFAELPAAWQDRFYYDRDRALLALKSERVAQARYDRAVEASLAEMEGKGAQLEIDESLDRLAGAVEDLQRQAAGAPREGPRDGGIIVNPPIIVHDNRFANDNRFLQDDFYCPPVVYPPIVRTPNLRVPTIRNGNSGHLEKPSLHDPTPLRPTSTVNRPGSRVTGSSTAVSRSRPTTRPSTPTPSPTVRRPATRSSSTATPVPRSRPAPAVQRRSAPVPRSSPTTRPSRSAPAAPARSRPTIRKR